MDALERVHAVLDRPFWPKHLEIGGEYRLQADDQDGREDTGWMTINLIDPGTITIQALTKQPAFEGDTRGFRLAPTVVTIRRTDGHSLVHQALLYLALAFRADSASRYSAQRANLVKTRSRRLEDVYSLLDCTPWLPSLESSKHYTIVGAEGNELSVLHTPFNDSYLIIGKSPGRSMAESEATPVAVTTCSPTRPSRYWPRQSASRTRERGRTSAPQTPKRWMGRFFVIIYSKS